MLPSRMGEIKRLRERRAMLPDPTFEELLECYRRTAEVLCGYDPAAPFPPWKPAVVEWSEPVPDLLAVTREIARGG
jgi:hypothetical protein